MLTAHPKGGRKKVFAVTYLLNINVRQLAVFWNNYTLTDIGSLLFCNILQSHSWKDARAFSLSPRGGSHIKSVIWDKDEEWVNLFEIECQIPRNHGT